MRVGCMNQREQGEGYLHVAVKRVVSRLTFFIFSSRVRQQRDFAFPPFYRLGTFVLGESGAEMGQDERGERWISFVSCVLEFVPWSCLCERHVLFTVTAGEGTSAVTLVVGIVFSFFLFWSERGKLKPSGRSRPLARMPPGVSPLEAMACEAAIDVVLELLESQEGGVSTLD